MVLPKASAALTVDEAELVALAQAGDDQAFTMLVALCETMLRAQVARFRFPKSEADDMAQEGLLGLLAAVRSFDQTKNVSFSTYASACVRNRLLSICRRRITHIPEIPLEDLSAVVEDTWCHSNGDPAAVVAEREAAEQMLTRIKSVLSPKEYTVLTLYLDGFSYAAIAQKLQMTPKAVDNALQRVRAKFRRPC